MMAIPVAALEAIKLAADRSRKPHAIRRATERTPHIDEDYLYQVDNYVRGLNLPKAHFYLPIDMGAPGTLRGYAAFKPTDNGPVLATVLKPHMVPQGLPLMQGVEEDQLAELQRFNDQLNQRIAAKMRIDKVAAAEFAPGIPEGKKIDRLPPVSSETTWPFVVHEHHALKAGKHYDLRLADMFNKAHSWAIRYWPNPGERRLAVQQPTHTKQYMSFQGEIEDGYGKGQVYIWKKGDAKIRSITDREVKFSLPKDDKNKEDKGWQDYTLVRTNDTQWLLIAKGGGAPGD